MENQILRDQILNEMEQDKKRLEILGAEKYLQLKANLQKLAVLQLDKSSSNYSEVQNAVADHLRIIFNREYLEEFCPEAIEYIDKHAEKESFNGYTLLSLMDKPYVLGNVEFGNEFGATFNDREASRNAVYQFILQNFETENVKDYFMNNEYKSARNELSRNLNKKSSFKFSYNNSYDLSNASKNYVEFSRQVCHPWYSPETGLYMGRILELSNLGKNESIEFFKERMRDLGFEIGQTEQTQARDYDATEEYTYDETEVHVPDETEVRVYDATEEHISDATEVRPNDQTQVKDNTQTQAKANDQTQAKVNDQTQARDYDATEEHISDATEARPNDQTQARDYDATQAKDSGDCQEF